MSPLRSSALALLSVAVTAAAIAGCDGGPEQITAEELVDRGDDICGEVSERFDEIQAAPLTSAAVGEKQAEELLDVTDDAQADLRDLEPPEEVRDTYESYLEARDDFRDLLERGREAAERRNGAAYGKAQEEAAAGAPERERLADELGFKVCSRDTRAP